jgi:hypothetical protein
MLEMIPAFAHAHRRLLEIAMKMLATAFCFLGAGLLFSSAAHEPSTNPERLKFKIEIRAAGEKGPGYAVTNLTAKSLTAGVFDLSYSSKAQGTWRSKIVWDSLLQNDPPIEPGRTVFRPLLLAVFPTTIREAS